VAIRREPTRKLRNWRFRGCLIKRAYTLEEAEARVANAVPPLTFYKCRFCESHHLTSRVTTPETEGGK
jgi:hypothetical protein